MLDRIYIKDPNTQFQYTKWNTTTANEENLYA